MSFHLKLQIFCYIYLHIVDFSPGYDIKLHLTVESQIALEDRMRLPQTTVTSRWPLAKA